uniref:Si:ch73-182a11.2 n=1 Tax=Astyanax mexicanus TaxID=7994 RepID=A0A8B9LR55_ASTMX
LTISDFSHTAVGSLAEWLADHSIMLAGALRLVLQALSNADLSVSTVSTLKRICRECRHHLRPHANDILTASQEVLVKQIHKTTQIMWLMQALGYLLSSLPDEEILGKLLSLLSPHIQQLERLANETVVVVLQQVFPLIQTLLSKWLKETEVVTAACAVFEKSLKTLIRDFAPLVGQLCELIGQLFSSYPQACALDLTRQLVHVFACEKEHFPPIAALLELVTSITMAIFQHGAQDHPDVADSFMQLHTQVMKRKPDVYLTGGLDIKVVFYCGILSFKFPETPTVKSTCLLFVSQYLIKTKSIGGQSRGLLEHQSEVMFSVSRYCPTLLSLQLRDALQPPGFPSALLTPEQKEHFCQQVLRYRWKMRDVIKEFSLLCQGLPGVEYAASY